MKKLLAITAIALSSIATSVAQEVNDVNTPLHLMNPVYQYGYGIPAQEDVKSTIDRVMTFLEGAMPAETVGDKLKTGTLRLTSYEIGVLYCAVQEAAKVTGDERYSKFAADRLGLIAKIEPTSYKRLSKDMKFDDQMRKVCFPTALDDAGAMCTGFIRYQIKKQADKQSNTQITKIIERYIEHVYRKQYRLQDGTLARIRPHYNTVWLDDMYMGIPCLAWYGKLTGNTEYYDEAIRQIRLFRDKMAVPQSVMSGQEQAILFRHGWVEEMTPHPFFPWGRANGWAILTMCEVLDVLPADYPGRNEILTLLRQHVAGLTAVQDKSGFWHQLLNDNTTYLETSATAIYTYCLAHAINEGWIDNLAYGAQALLAWHAVSSQVNAKGQVENTCVGSGMGFDPAFYACRPVHVMAAHGYGPVIWAGGEIIRMLQKTHPKMNDSAVQFYATPQKTNEPIFSEQREGVEDEKVLW
ncbi:MAG: glycoside hydrolase family 88 protein [Prevotella sp.]|nr:glycoside hydrolase family 88 protein [Candidatus Prevotella equi]